MCVWVATTPRKHQTAYQVASMGPAKSHLVCEQGWPSSCGATWSNLEHRLPLHRILVQLLSLREDFFIQVCFCSSSFTVYFICISRTAAVKRHSYLYMRQERLIAAKYINTYLVCHTRNTTARNFNLSQVKKKRNTFSKHKKSTFNTYLVYVIPWIQQLSQELLKQKTPFFGKHRSCCLPVPV